MMRRTFQEIIALDHKDPLASFRNAFHLKDGLIYLDGNSLGALPKATSAKMETVVREEWGGGLITSWLGAEWVTAPRRIGDKIAKIVGADVGEIIATDSTSINIFKALTACISLHPERPVILSEDGNFPTDVYMMQGIEAFSRGRIKSITTPPETLLDRLDDDVAALLLTQVHYKSGRIRDLAAVTARAHEKGVPVIWDLSHSTGAIEVDLNGANADFAVGCGYKFLNGGPGSPAYIFVASRHQQSAVPILSGWFGHARPFAFESDYDPAHGIERFLCGTPPILGLASLECGVDLHLSADMQFVRQKSKQLGNLFVELMEELCTDYGFKMISPGDPESRGSHVSFSHPNGYEIMQALKVANVIGDFRAPNVLRFGLTPLYLRYQDVFNAVKILREICVTHAWDKPQFRVRAAVT